jgi:hypothetical protein
VDLGALDRAEQAALPPARAVIGLAPELASKPRAFMADSFEDSDAGGSSTPYPTDVVSLAYT